jgi:hypothetical protein
VRNLGALAAVLLTLMALVCVAPAVAQPVVEEDVVAQLWDAGADAPVGVAFGRHAAIYQLARNDPSFAPWLAILQRSLRDGTPVRFAYDLMGPAGPRLTLVEPAH